jgi:L,D-peptidoglycan transpeptidase YkuD (ErfK/YbiS/YcfS/YnhG family)
MSKYIFMIKRIVACLFLITGSACAQIESANQLLVVVSPDWHSTVAKMYLFDRTESGWIQNNVPWNVNLGDSGLAWGEGLQQIPDGGRIKEEGDRCSPAGIFELGDIYGYGETAPNGVAYPYHQSSRTLHCVDDTGSVFYNTLIDEGDVLRDAVGHLPWKSSEMMVLDSADYKFVIPVKMNPRAIPGKGSCVFLHLASHSVPPTAGCTSMEEDRMMFLMQWLDQEKHPLLVQLPKSEFNRYLIEWHLPLPSRN